MKCRLSQSRSAVTFVLECVRWTLTLTLALICVAAFSHAQVAGQNGLGQNGLGQNGLNHTSGGGALVGQASTIIDSDGSMTQQPSPLSLYSADQNRLDRIKRLPPTASNLISREVDFSEPLRKYAAIHKCSLNEAFSETVKFLGLVHLSDPAAQKFAAASGIYSQVGKDRYRISATQGFFDQLPTQLECIANGKRLISISVRMVSVPVHMIEDLTVFLNPDSYSRFDNQFAQQEPLATTASLGGSMKFGTPNVNQAGGTFVRASEIRTKVMPTFTGMLSDDRLASLLNTMSKREGVTIEPIQNCIVMPGQPATICNAASRPFVIGILGDRNANGLNSRFTNSPVIQTLEDGIILRFQATAEGNAIDLRGDFAFSEVTSVETCEFKGPLIVNGVKQSPRETLTVQVPEQKVKQVHLSTSLQPGQTLFVDPIVKGASPRQNVNDRAKSPNDDTRVIMLVTARLTDAK